MLADADLRFDIPVRDLTRAKKFYTERLGLTSNHQNQFSVQFRYSDSYFVLTPAQSAGKADHSLLTWLVEDIIQVSEWLKKRGIEFEEFDLGETQTSDGIVHLEGDQIAWFKDSEGNLLAIAQLG